MITEPGGVKTQVEHDHNHPPLPPANQRVRPEVKDVVVSQLGAGATPSAILRNLVNNAPQPVSRKDVPTKQQVYNWQHQIHSANLPTGEAM